MSDKDLVLNFDKEPEPESDEIVIVGEAEAFSYGDNIFYRLENGNKYKYIWHNNRRLKVEAIAQAESDVDTNFYLCGVSDDPYSIEEYDADEIKKGSRYCRPFERQVQKINVAPDLIGTKWGKEALAYLECVNPKFLSVVREYKGGTLSPHQWELGEVQVIIDKTDSIVSVVKQTYVGLPE